MGKFLRITYKLNTYFLNMFGMSVMRTSISEIIIFGIKGMTKTMKSSLIVSLGLIIQVLTACSEPDDVNELLILQNKALAESDYIKASEYAEKACKLNSGTGCYTFGELFVIGSMPDYVKARGYMDKSCELNCAEGCVEAGVMYFKGLGVEHDQNKALQYFDKSCNLKLDMGCFMAGAVYELGQGLEQNLQKAADYYRKACDLKFREGCEGLERLR